MRGSDLPRSIVPLVGRLSDHDSLLNLVGDSQLVLIGASTHGTRDFHRLRATITKRLLAERGFNAVCIEGDWPAAERVNRFVLGEGDAAGAEQALDGFKRFPSWLWRNAEVREFIEWLRRHNDRCAVQGLPKAGFYGLDIFSFNESIGEVVRNLQQVDPAIAERARQRYETPNRENVLAELVEIQRYAPQYERSEGVLLDAYFSAEQNARVVANAEQYFSILHSNATVAWNLREMHMHYTLDRLSRHLAAQHGSARVVAWLHNVHAGNAAGTSMSREGRTSVGALLRRRYGNAVVLVGSTTYRGSVTAAAEWHELGEHRKLRPARPDSFEYACHGLETPRLFMPLRGNAFETIRLPPVASERLVGVVYGRGNEAEQPYLMARLGDQFDALYFLDTTHAVDPLEPEEIWEDGEPPSTYPTGL